ncbi:MAG: class I SAM-dependent methyltransferase [Verrucomicrobiaceae bacterium]|nr:class I SAM-dependent methyltransferase [Verrucomicrobiaceae bacterium]
METDSGSIVPNSCSTANNLTVLQHYVSQLPVGDTLEVGLAFGASATLLSLYHHKRGVGTVHHAIDPFQTSQWGNAAMKHLGRCGLQGHFQLHAEPSALAMADLVRANKKFVLVYIDGSHLFEHVMSDFMLADQLLIDGGILAFDDSSCDHVAKVVAFVRANFSDAYKEESPYDITAPAQSWWKTRLAKLLGRQQLTIFRRLRASTRAWGTPLTNF